MPSAKYVQFLSYYDKQVEKWASETSIFWPYSEGLRMDEAMHPLRSLTFGLYGEVLPNQNGAPIRIVVPWKYGFKSAKSIVAVRFLDKSRQPPGTSRIRTNTDSIPTSIPTSITHAGARKQNAALVFLSTRSAAPTLMFNGYGDQVASLYNGMDLKKNF